MKLKLSKIEALILLEQHLGESLKGKGVDSPLEVEIENEEPPEELPGAIEAKAQPDGPLPQSGLNTDLVIYFQAICQTDTEEQVVLKLETIPDINKDAIENLLVADQDDVIKWYLNYYSLKDYKNVS